MKRCRCCRKIVEEYDDEEARLCYDCVMMIIYNYEK